MADTHFKWLIFLVCMAGYPLYGVVQTFGMFKSHLATWYTLTPTEIHWLYFSMMLGATGLSFVPGICLDRLGAWRTSLLGLIFGALPLSSQIVSYAFDPNHHFTQRTIWGLYLHFVSMGLCASFLDILCSIVPMLVFSAQNAGKVSGALQVSKSLGMAIQGAADTAFFQGDHAVLHHQIYMLALTLSFFPVAAILFWQKKDLIEHGSSVDDENGKETEVKQPRGGPSLTLHEIFCNLEFWYMVALFFVTIAFYISLLELEVSIAGTLDVASSTITISFGIINTLTRVSGALLFDCTRKYRFGGGLTYIVISQAVFVGGLCLLLLPASPEFQHMYAANVLFAIGFGGTMGIFPPTLRILVGPRHLGKIYGGLCIGIITSLPFWTALSGASGSQGFSAYRSYLIGGCIGLSCMVAFGLLVIILPQASDRHQSSLSSDDSELSEDTLRDSS